MRKTFLLVVGLVLSTTIFGQRNLLEGFTTSKEGVKHKFVKTNPQGQAIKQNDLIIGKFSIKFGDSLVVDANTMQAQPLVRADESSKMFKGDLVDGLFLMKKGEVCTFAFERDSIAKLFGDNLPPYFISGMYAFWTIEVIDIKTQKEQEVEEAVMRKQQEEKMAKEKIIADSLQALEPIVLEKAINDYGFDAKLINGVYFKKTTANKSNQTPKKGDNVKVHYIGKFTDGKLFDTSVETAAKEAGLYNPNRPYEPLEFTIGQGQMILGFEEAVKMMNKGEKAIVLIPSKLAYGLSGRGQIPAASPLIFELELVDIVPATPSLEFPNTKQESKKK